jgi:tRNA (guanosine-2'-O-)-methyltransferase
MPRRLRQIHPDNAHLEMTDAMTDARAERLAAVARQRQRGLMVLMEDVYNPFNLAAIARTCDAFGVQSLGFMCQSRERFDPREAGALASRSAARWVDYRLYVGGTVAVLGALRAEGWRLVATDAAPDALPLPAAPLAHEKTVLLVGNEQRGLSHEALALADIRVVIPMTGMVQSLNVSVAAALVLYEIVQQRARRGGFVYTPEESEALLRRWRAADSLPKRRSAE